MDFAFHAPDGESTPGLQDIALRIKERRGSSRGDDPAADLRQTLELLERELGGQA
jgi:hypothetical protein